jgi:hypothetical protein
METSLIAAGASTEECAKRVKSCARSGPGVQIFVSR